jgi:cobyrinic acid a,c-diamide synthase
MMIQCPRITIAGISGDAGKTVVSVGLSRLLFRKGYKVIPFKKGPDYIDMSWLSMGAGHPCYNLDLFLMSKEEVLFSFGLNTQQADIALLEGNRGLYDGMDMEGSVSTAEVAKLLYSPVVLLVDCSKVTRTVAALVLGCQRLDPNVPIRGIILNRLGSPRHEDIIRKSIEHYSQLPVVGAIPRLKNITFPGRHLGLVPPQEHPEAQRAIDNAAEMVGKYLDIDTLWGIARQAPPLKISSKFKVQSSKLQIPPIPPLLKGGEGGLRIGVIKDSAFQFYYPENIDALKRAGAEILEFSALTEGSLPSIHALYIGGGFPETHAPALAANEKLKHSIKKAALEGLPIYAECGGLMYLAEKLLWKGKEYPLAGIFPMVIGVSEKPKGHGYTILEVDAPNPFFRMGQILHGHEFHYSHIIDMCEKDGIYFAFKMEKGQGIKNHMDGLCYKNVLATYTHLHALGTKEWAEGILTVALAYKEQRHLQKAL